MTDETTKKPRRKVTERERIERRLEAAKKKRVAAGARYASANARFERAVTRYNLEVEEAETDIAMLAAALAAADGREAGAGE